MGQQEGITIHLNSKEELATIIKALHRTNIFHGVINTAQDDIIESLVEQLASLPSPDTTLQ